MENDQRHIWDVQASVKAKWQLGKCTVLGTEPQAGCCSQNLSLYRHADFRLKALPPLYLLPVALLTLAIMLSLPNP